MAGTSPQLLTPKASALLARRRGLWAGRWRLQPVMGVPEVGPKPGACLWTCVNCSLVYTGGAWSPRVWLGPLSAQRQQQRWPAGAPWPGRICRWLAAPLRHRARAVVRAPGRRGASPLRHVSGQARLVSQRPRRGCHCLAAT
eukprot:scaffold2119_cov355-Prasinococcus_capsulatus_cf.AAC.17